MTELDDWLGRMTEEALEPGLPICDPHHHLWDQRETFVYRYLLDEFFADMSGGHNIVSTVFLECEAFYRSKVDANMAPVGETEFVRGMAAMPRPMPPMMASLAPSIPAPILVCCMTKPFAKVSPNWRR